jgi:hypothetical protein
MKLLRILFVLASVASVASSFHIPANQTNGVYKVYYNTNATEVHVSLTSDMLQDDAALLFSAHLVAPPSASSSSSSAPTLLPRARFGLWERIRENRRRSYCDCGDNLDHSDADAATELLRNIISAAGGTAYVPIGQGIYGTVNGVTAFVCTPDKNTAVTPIDRNAFDYALRFVTEKCGRYVPGTYVHGDLNGENWNQKASQEDMGYKNNKYGDVWVCDHAEEAKRDHC